MLKMEPKIPTFLFIFLYIYVKKKFKMLYDKTLTGH